MAVLYHEPVCSAARVVFLVVCSHTGASTLVDVDAMVCVAVAVAL